MLKVRGKTRFDPTLRRDGLFHVSCISTIQTALAISPGEITGPHSLITGNVSGVYGDCTYIRGNVSNIAGDVTYMKGDVSGLEGYVTLESFMATGVFGNVSGSSRVLSATLLHRVLPMIEDVQID
jgi:hypothetical protein